MKKLRLSLVALAVGFAGIALTEFRSTEVHAQSATAFLQTATDITGTGVAVVLQSTSKPARWIQIVAAGGNAAAVRFGDVNVSATRGATITAGAGQFFPPLPIDGRDSTQNKFYDLGKIYLFIGSGDKVSITWAQ